MSESDGSFNDLCMFMTFVSNQYEEKKEASWASNLQFAYSTFHHIYADLLL